MEANSMLSGKIHTDNLRLDWSEAPWDSAIFESPVLQITSIEIGTNLEAAQRDSLSFIQARQSSSCYLVSCRIGAEKIREGFFLESFDFKFIEMVYHPYVTLVENNTNNNKHSRLTVARATTSSLEKMIAAAELSFGNERFHIDPRIPNQSANRRYANWVKNSIQHPSQELYGIWDHDKLIAFFITEDLPNDVCYWHLTAVFPEHQGKGYGPEIWYTMMSHAWNRGCQTIKTCIAARNYRVINLYARTGFSFSAPLMTYHWMPQ